VPKWWLPPTKERLDEIMRINLRLFLETCEDNDWDPMSFPEWREVLKSEGRQKEGWAKK
jgi:hypothetical protein